MKISIIWKVKKGAIFMLFILSWSAFAQPNYVNTPTTETPASKPTLLVFSGSDWCIPCIKFKREVLENKEFVSFSKEYLLIKVADFPQHKILSKKEIIVNEDLAEKYNPNGYFPYVLLLDINGEVLTQLKTNKVTAKMVIAQISKKYPTPKKKEFNTTVLLMGSSFQIAIIANELNGEQYIRDCITEIKHIEGWLSSWKETSITSQINKEASKKAIWVPNEYYELVKRCLAISVLTQGAFDITCNGISELYKFDKKERLLPNDFQLKNKLKGVGYQHVALLDSQKVFLNNELVQVGFGAIGKGYAAEKVKQLMQAKGVSGGVINASGDLTTWGTRANGDAWNVGIPDPSNKQNIILWLPVKNKAIATSGDYEKYFTYQGKHFSHIINPKTGLPVVGASSVSIISDNAEFSDALATAVSVLGLEIGMDLVNQLSGVECVFIDDNRKLHFSSGVQTHAN